MHDRSADGGDGRRPREAIRQDDRAGRRSTSRSARGRCVGLLGPNGAGKTTAVRILATLLRPDGGRAEVAGFDVVRQAGQVRRRIGLVGQNAAVDEILSGRQNLVMFGRLYHLGRRQAGSCAPTSSSSTSASPTPAASR